MFIPKRGSVRNGKDIRNGVAGLGNACDIVPAMDHYLPRIGD
jgi:hypothetical protein